MGIGRSNRKKPTNRAIKDQSQAVTAIDQAKKSDWNFKNTLVHPPICTNTVLAGSFRRAFRPTDQAESLFKKWNTTRLPQVNNSYFLTGRKKKAAKPIPNKPEINKFLIGRRSHWRHIQKIAQMIADGAKTKVMTLWDVSWRAKDKLRRIMFLRWFFCVINLGTR